jgi:hypothetical protein
MITLATNLRFRLAILFALAPACASSAGGNDGSAGNAGSAGTSGGAGMSATGDVLILPDPSGWVEAVDNPLGIQGAWYPYGDRYGVAKCLNVGLHQPEECSLITSPLPPPSTGFPNANGVMCTSGETAVILPCPTGLATSGCPASDFANMWGAGIGFDFNANKGMPEGDGKKNTFDPVLHGIKGVSFELDKIPGPKLRVEFPQQLTNEEASMVQLPAGSTTDDHPDGAPYWGADNNFSASRVVVSPEVNVILWDQVKKPGSSRSYVFDTARMLGIQFHVPAVSTAPRGTYDFCVKNLKFLRD